MIFEALASRERATKDGEVLREHVHEATIDAAIAGDEAVTRRALRFHAEIMGLMANKLVELFERAFVEQQVDAFARAELALLVLAFAALCSAALFGFGVELAQLLDAVVTLCRACFPSPLPERQANTLRRIFPSRNVGL